MTTFQDQPPQSRRAVRQSERENDANAQALSAPFVVQPEPAPFIQQATTPPEAADAPADSDSTVPPPASGRRARSASSSGLHDVPPQGAYPEPLTYTTQAKAGFPQAAPVHSAEQRAEQQRAEQLRSDQQFRVRDFSPEGRRAAAPAGPPVAEPSPLDYRTQGGPGFVIPPAAPVDDDTIPPAAVTPAQAEPEAAQPETSEAPATRGLDDNIIDAGISDDVEEINLAEEPNDEHLDAVPKLDDTVLPEAFRQPEAWGTPTGVTDLPTGAIEAPAAGASGFPRQPMTRREMRAMQAAADAAAASGTFAVPPLVEPSAAAGAEPAAVSSAIDEFEALTRAAEESAAAQALAGDIPGVAPHPDATVQPSASATVHPAFAAPAADSADTAEQHDSAAAHVEADDNRDAPTAEPAAPVEAPADTTPEAPAQAHVPTSADPGPTSPFEALFTVPGDGPAPANLTMPPSKREPERHPEHPPVAPGFDSAVSTQTGSHATSTGHWSQQAAQEDELPYENTISRQVGLNNVATTTSALVLPTIPHTGDIGSIVAGTGEILVTGSIDLPRSVSTTGGDARRYDDPDVDSLFDSLDNEIVTTDSAPVRAIRAVSTHTSTHGVIQTHKPKGNKMFVILMASTVGLAVAAVTLLGVATGVFNQ